MCKKTFSAVLAVLILLCLLSGCATSGNGVDEARSGVVRLFIVDQYGNLAVASAVGVGRPGEEPTYFVTNHHAVSDENGDVVLSVYILRDSYAVPLTADGAVDLDHLDLSRMIPADVVYRADNAIPDLAVIRASEPVPGRTALPLAKAEDTLKPGDTVYALGYPTSADLSTFTESGGTISGSAADLTVTNGIVSRLTEFGPMGGTRIVQHTAPINPGNSGGALVSESGAVVGINYGAFNADGMSSGEQNHYVAIESEYVMDILTRLNIEYSPLGPDFPTPMIVGIAAAAVLIVIVVAVIVSQSKKPRKETLVTPPAVETIPEISTSDQEITQPVPEPEPQPQPAHGGYRIQGIAGTFANRRFAVNGCMRIGRDPQRNDLVYPGNTKGISGVHCVLVEDGDLLVLQDLGSTYGTFVAGSRLAASETINLHRGDRFWLGSEQESFLVDWKD